MNKDEPVPSPIDDFLNLHTEITRVHAIFSDMNGVLRGKWLPRAAADKIGTGGVRLPVSTSALDMWGHDVDGSGLGIISGDKDGIGVPIWETLAPVPWEPAPTAQIMMTLETADGAASPYEARNLLAAVQERYAARGLTPVVATELEFFLLADGAIPPRPPAQSEHSHLYDFGVMEAHQPFLDDVIAACAVQNLPADVVIAESGLGQFEINFNHQPDALRAADHAVLFRRLVRGVARKHGMAATFMAKPYGGDAGSGMHVHASILGPDGANIFAADPAALAHAVAGQLESLQALQLVFAPHLNSYRRFDTEGFAPVAANWGYDHRAAAVRIPDRAGPAARFEHRVAGADVNPYLAIAAILAGALDGLNRKADPGPAIEDGGAPGKGALTWDWLTAVDHFQNSDATADLLIPEFARVFGIVKRFECQEFARIITAAEYDTFLGRL